MKGYVWNLLIGIDQLFNTVFGGHPDETLSSRMGRDISKKDGDPSAEDHIADGVCKVLDVIDKNHCVDSIEFKDGKPDPHHLEGFRK